MEFVVNDKKFTDYEQAKIYEDELKKMKSEDEAKRKAFYERLVAKRVSFSDSNSASSRIVACVADCDTSDMFLKATIENVFGSEVDLHIENGKPVVVRNYKVSDISDDELEVIRDYFVTLPELDREVKGSVVVGALGTVFFCKEAYNSEDTSSKKCNGCSECKCNHKHNTDSDNGSEPTTFNSFTEFFEYLLNM